MNYHFDKVIGFNETGFAGKADATYRRQAWRFMLAGGALFNHLDYSFSVGNENGQDTAYSAPGGGSPALRQQLGVLKNFMHSLDLTSMAPDATWIKSARGAFVQALSNRCDQYALYAEGISSFRLVLNIPKGNYLAEWTHPSDGRKTKEQFTHAEGEKILASPLGTGEATLKLTRKK